MWHHGAIHAAVSQLLWICWYVLIQFSFVSIVAWADHLFVLNCNAILFSHHFPYLFSFDANEIFQLCYMQKNNVAKFLSLLRTRHGRALWATNPDFSLFKRFACTEDSWPWGKNSVTRTITIGCYGTLDSALWRSAAQKSSRITLTWKLRAPFTANADSKHPAGVPPPARHPRPVQSASAGTGRWISSFCLERASSPGSHNDTPSHHPQQPSPPPTGCVSAPALPACVTCGARKFAQPDFLPSKRRPQPPQSAGVGVWRGGGLRDFSERSSFLSVSSTG